MSYPSRIHGAEGCEALAEVRSPSTDTLANAIRSCRAARAVAAFGGRGREHGAGEHQQGEVADEEGGEFGRGEGVGVLDVGEVGAAAEDAPAGEGGEGGEGGGAAAEDLGALGGEPVGEVAQAPERGLLAELGRADGDGVEDLLGLGEALGGWR